MSKTYEKRTDGNSYKVIFIGVEWYEL
jgi:hypothetical protein